MLQQSKSAPQTSPAGDTLPTGWKLSGVEEQAGNDGYTDAEIDEVADNPSLWGAMFGKVEHRLTKDPIPFVPTVLQRRMDAHYRHCQERDIPCRIVALKIRRGCGSSGATKLLYCHLHNYRTRAGVIGTDYTVSKNLMSMVKFYDQHDTFPGWARSCKSIDDIVEWPNGSSVERYTAENPEASRSAGLQAYHASEVARWQDSAAISAKQTLRSIRGSVPRKGFTLGIEESTAAGSEGAFADTWASARWPDHADWWRPWENETPNAPMEVGEELQYVRIFAAWFEDAECSMTVTPEQQRRIEATLDQKEQDLITRYRKPGPRGDRLGAEVNATLWEQLAWRRSVIAVEFEGDVDGFDQENPSSPAVAFSSTGRHTFSRPGCEWMVGLARSRAPELGVLVEQPDGGVIFSRTAATDAWVEMHEAPKIGHRYLESVDTMSGREQIKNTGISDWNAAGIIRAGYIDDEGTQRAPKVVMSLLEKNDDDPDVLVKKTHLMSKFYGGCLVVPEVNNTGYAYIALAKAAGVNLYRREEFDKVTQEFTEHSGWKTDPKTRPQVIAILQAAIRANGREETRGHGIDCPTLYIALECQAMVQHPDGVDRAPRGRHDDGAMMLGIGLVNISSASYYAGARRRRSGPSDRGSWTPFRKN